ncbi:MAG: DnaJ domain-containing protein [Nitrospina sp.]|nr:DnaJ domain-containing protein [Nitrospina sp.]MBT6602242.1 DnaJ domain-containing protein [Nitrospina sp.]
MSWIVGAGMGFLRGGPMGAVIGGALQHILTKKLQSKIQKSLPGLIDQGVFVTCIAVVMTKISMVRGTVKPQARTAIKFFFQKNLNYSIKELNFIDNVVDQTQKVNPDLDPIVRQYCKACNDHYTSLLLALAYRVALSEGQLTEVVQNELNSLSKLLSLSYEQHDLIRKKYYLIALKTPYTLFGVSPNSSNAEVKKAYHQMVMAYHPDKTAHLGEDEAQKAHLKFLEIMEAYKELENERGII